MLKFEFFMTVDFGTKMVDFISARAGGFSLTDLISIHIKMLVMYSTQFFVAAFAWAIIKSDFRSSRQAELFIVLNR